MFISICTVGIGIGMMALRKKSLLLRHTSTTIGYHQPTISTNTLRGIGTIYPSESWPTEGTHWVLVQANQDVDSVYVEAYWDVAEAPPRLMI